MDDATDKPAPSKPAPLAPALDIEAIRKRCELATPGPWCAHNPDDRMAMNAYAVSTSKHEPTIDGALEDDNDYAEVVALTMLQSPRLACHGAQRWAEDAEFIASARSDVPALCDLVVRIYSELARQTTVADVARKIVGDSIFPRCGRWAVRVKDTVRLREYDSLSDALAEFIRPIGVPESAVRSAMGLTEADHEVSG